jgi:ATP-dependent Clp protease protease subunit
MGAFLLAGGAPGKRFAVPNARIMIHQPLGGASGQATDIEIQTREILRIKARLNELLAKHCKQPIERVEKDTDRDYFMGPGEAKEYGLIDEVIVHRQRGVEKK